MDNKLITVTSPLLPNLDDFNEMLKQIWESKWITNNGLFHKQLEKELATYLKVPYISLFTNGTLPANHSLASTSDNGRSDYYALQFCCHYTRPLVERHKARVCGY